MNILQNGYYTNENGCRCPLGHLAVAYGAPDYGPSIDTWIWGHRSEVTDFIHACFLELQKPTYRDLEPPPEPGSSGYSQEFHDLVDRFTSWSDHTLREIVAAVVKPALDGVTKARNKRRRMVTQ